MKREIKLDEDEFDTYDSEGNMKPGSLYDVGGHPITNHWADYIDYARERAKEEKVLGE